MKLRRLGLALTLLLVFMLGGVINAQEDDEPVTIRWFVGLGTGINPEQIPPQEQIVEEFNASQDDIILEVAAARKTERGGRADDMRSATSMEDRKKQGYF